MEFLRPHLAGEETGPERAEECLEGVLKIRGGPESQHELLTPRTTCLTTCLGSNGLGDVRVVGVVCVGGHWEERGFAL